MGKKLKPTQLTAVMINLQDMLNVLLSKSTVMMLNLLTMLNVFMRKLNQLTVTMKLTLVKVPAEELLVELGKVVKAVNLNLNLVRKMTNQSLVRKDQKENLVRKDQKENLVRKLNQVRKTQEKPNRERKLKVNQERELKKQRRTKNQLK